MPRVVSAQPRRQLPKMQVQSLSIMPPPRPISHVTTSPGAPVATSTAIAHAAAATAGACPGPTAVGLSLPAAKPTLEPPRSAIAASHLSDRLTSHPPIAASAALPAPIASPLEPSSSSSIATAIAAAATPIATLALPPSPSHSLPKCMCHTALRGRLLQLLQPHRMLALRVCWLSFLPDSGRYTQDQASLASIRQ